MGKKTMEELLNKPGFREWLEETDFTHMLENQKENLGADEAEAEAEAEEVPERRSSRKKK